MDSLKDLKDKISALHKQLENKNKEIIEAEKEAKIKKIEYRKIKKQIELLRLDIETQELNDIEAQKKRKMRASIDSAFKDKYLDKYYSTDIDENKNFAESYVKSRGMY